MKPQQTLKHWEEVNFHNSHSDQDLTPILQLNLRNYWRTASLVILSRLLFIYWVLCTHTLFNIWNQESHNLFCSSFRGYRSYSACKEFSSSDLLINFSGSIWSTCRYTSIDWIDWTLSTKETCVFKHMQILQIHCITFPWFQMLYLVKLLERNNRNDSDLDKH